MIAVSAFTCLPGPHNSIVQGQYSQRLVQRKRISLLGPLTCLLTSGNNQSYASPVNRIRITGSWASRSLVTSHSRTLGTRLRESARHLVFLTVLFFIDVFF